MFEFIGTLLQLSATLLSLVIKVPQIIKVVKAGNAEGLELKSVALELWGFSSMMMKTFGRGFPIIMQLEGVFFLAQNTFLLFYVLNYQKKLNAKSVGIFLICVFIQALLGLDKLPHFIAYIIHNGNLVLMIFGIGMQIKKIIQSKSIGSLSVETALIVIYIMSVRLPIIWSIGDAQMKFGFSVAFTLNAMLTSTILFYRNSKPNKQDDKKSL